MKTRPFLPNVVAVTLFVVFFMVAGAAFGQPLKTWEFEVRLDGKAIGGHTYTVNDSGARTTVTSDARFDVRFLFLTALKYRHKATETWQEDCLTSIDAQTFSNSKKQLVAGVTEADRLKIVSDGGAATFTNCVKTFAYWNPDILGAQALLNAQTGEYVKIEVTALGDDVVTVGFRDVRARKYALRSTSDAVGKPVDLLLWYSADTHAWLALESTVAGDRVLRYQPVNVPQRAAALDRRTGFQKDQW